MRAVIFLSLLLAACGAGRKHMERAATYEREGMYPEAFAVYAERYEHSDRNVEAHVGMKRTAQQISQRIQNEASGHYMAHDFDAGERIRQQVVAYHATMARKGIQLEWSPEVETRRREAMRYEADLALGKAREALSADRFEEAEELARRCLKFDPERTEAEYVAKLAVIEPLYRQGLRAMELGLWRDGYRTFARVTDRDAGYKDAWNLQEQCREQAQLVIAYVPLYNGSIYANEFSTVLSGTSVESQLAATIKEAILKLNDPLIVLVDRDNTDRLLAEQRRQMSGVYDDRYGAEAGKLLGANYVLTGKVLRFDDVLSKQIEVQVQLIDTESGRIHLSELVRVNKQELARGAPRAQLLERASKRAALRLAEFDPHER